MLYVFAQESITQQAKGLLLLATLSALSKKYVAVFLQWKITEGKNAD